MPTWQKTLERRVHLIGKGGVGGSWGGRKYDFLAVRRSHETETNFCTLVLKRSEAGERNKPVTAVCLHGVVSREALLRKEPFKVLEQMIIIGRLLYDHARPHAALCIQRLLQRFRWEVFDHSACTPDLAPSDYHLIQHLKSFLA
ncbi:hypothetical protein AVEN_22294-1 [Araneus ventricosus]|uniref:Uncharacterized protein n=1 Tax=Araneus ventricosus TaxID=182803 RepID=A0A4Y2J6K9_ARAVE|nr:hypothetical protein AVEN_133228-1 [Araneus ventricosus]GBO34308.1 hypothetical protein AVEN_22294-1 [Araneus ventricosus]